MSEGSLIYLRPNVKLEPLVGRWYAWSHLISPVQLALNLEFRYIPLLRSYLNNPAIHRAAALDPQLFCGPYINLDADATEPVERLLEELLERSRELRQYALALRELEIRLPKIAQGAALDEIYEGLPECLRGTLELSYDCQGVPVVRVMEEMLYSGGLDGNELQEVSLYAGDDGNRGFFLNTPRLGKGSRLDLSIPFQSPRLDLLSKLRSQPAPFSQVCAALDLTADQAGALRDFTTERPPTRRGRRYTGEGVRIRYFGHACVLVETAEVSILFDPVVAWEDSTREASLTFADLPERIDYLILTHNHQDHVSVETLLQLRTRVGQAIVPAHNPYNSADPSLRMTLCALGFPRVATTDPLGTIALPDGRITPLPFLGEHADLSIHSKQGAFLEILGVRLLFLADSNCLDRILYRRLAADFGRVDALFIGMECHGAPLSWLYGPYLSKPPTRRQDESRRLSGSNSERAWAVVEEIGCDRVFVYAMGQEPWLRHILGLAYTSDSVQLVESDQLVTKARARGLEAERLYGCGDIHLRCRERARADRTHVA